MTEEKVIKEKEQELEVKDKVDESPAEVEKTEHTIPKSRFDEVNKKYKESETRLNALEKKIKDTEEQRLIDDKNWEELSKKLADELGPAKAKAELYDDNEKALAKYVESQFAEIPEHLQSLVPKNQTSLEKIEYLELNKALLTQPKPFDIGAGKRGGAESKSVPLEKDQKEMAQKLGIPDEEYAKNL